MAKFTKEQLEKICVGNGFVDVGTSALFHVCNDYSLEKVTIEQYLKENWEDYRRVDVENGLRYNFIHKEYRELHYAMVSTKSKDYPQPDLFEHVARQTGETVEEVTQRLDREVAAGRITK